MKKLSFTLFAATAILCASCGSSKKAATPIATSDNNVMIVDQDQCLILANEQGDFVRGFGIGTSPNRMLAYNLAVDNAKAEIAKSLQLEVETSLKNAVAQDNVADENGSTYKLAEKTLTALQTRCQSEVKGARVIESQTYKKGNQNLYEVHVCAELGSSVKEDVTEEMFRMLKEERK